MLKTALRDEISNGFFNFYTSQWITMAKQDFLNHVTTLLDSEGVWNF